MLQRILIPTDGSALGDYAYNLAHQIAQAAGAHITLLAVAPAPASVVFDETHQLKDYEGDNLPEIQREIMQLQTQLKLWSQDKADVDQIVVQAGRVDDEILYYLNHHPIDLVVMGTAGALGVKEWLTGSHAQQIVRNSPAPVLTLKCDRSDMVIKDMLMVSDFHDPKRQDLGMVKTLQQLFGARLNLVKINTPHDFDPTRIALANMSRFAELNELTNTAFHLYCDESVENGVMHCSGDLEIDFVCIGAHQRKGLSRLLKGSISEDIVNHIWQPILTFGIA